MCAAKEIGTLNKNGMAALSRGDLMNAEFLLHQAIRRAEGLGVDAFAAKLRNNLGLVYSQQGKNTQAAEQFRIALNAIDQKIGRENTLYASVCNNLSSVDIQAACAASGC